MTPAISSYMARKSLEKAAVREIQNKIRMSELLPDKSLEKKYQMLLKCEKTREDRNSTEHVIVGRRPEQFTSDAVSRLYRDGFTPEQWSAADMDERANILQCVGSIMSQEMLLPQEVRRQIQIRVKDSEGTINAPDRSALAIEIDKSFIENNDCKASYSKLYREMSVLECRNSMNESGFSTDYSEGIARRPVISETAYADAQMCEFVKKYREFGEGDIKSPYLRKRTEIEPEQSMDKISEWPRMIREMTLEENLKACNPNYRQGIEWQKNCQRCVPTYEMRSRGYDVTAKSRAEGVDHLAQRPFDAWENAEVYKCHADGMNEIQTALKKWGDNSRAQVVVYWNRGAGGHTFVAEQRDGVTHFIDPQNGETDASWYFKNVMPGSVQFCRTDHLQPSTLILDCCKGVKI